MHHSWMARCYFDPVLIAQLGNRRCLINELEDALLEQLFGKADFDERCASNITPPTPSGCKHPVTAVDL